MIAVDTNILVYAHRAESIFHQQAKSCLKTLAEGGRPWGFPAACLHEFLAVVTNPRIFEPPSSLVQALDQVNAWLASPQAQILHTGLQHWPILSSLALKGKLRGGQFHDARIAATCLENGVELLWSADRDFARFKSLKTLNPLV